jgi:hypothetical protein
MAKLVLLECSGSVCEIVLDILTCNAMNCKTWKYRACIIGKVLIYELHWLVSDVVSNKN